MSCSRPQCNSQINAQESKESSWMLKFSSFGSKILSFRCPQIPQMQKNIKITGFQIYGKSQFYRIQRSASQ